MRLDRHYIDRHYTQVKIFSKASEMNKFLCEIGCNLVRIDFSDPNYYMVVYLVEYE